MNIKRFMVALGMIASMWAGGVGHLATPVHAVGPMAKYCKVVFPVIAGLSKITGQLITDNSFRCEKRVLGTVNGVGVIVLATYSVVYNSYYGITTYKSTCIVAYNTSFGQHKTQRDDTYGCGVTNNVQGVQFFAFAGNQAL